MLPSFSKHVLISSPPLPHGRRVGGRTMDLAVLCNFYPQSNESSVVLSTTEPTREHYSSPRLSTVHLWFTSG